MYCFLVINIFVNGENTMVKRLCSPRQTSPWEKISFTHWFLKKKSFRYIKSNREVWRGWEHTKKGPTESMVRCKRAYLRVAAVCVGALYLIYIFGMLEKTSRIVRTDAKDLNGTSNTSLHICPMISPYLSK